MSWYYLYRDSDGVWLSDDEAPIIPKAGQSVKSWELRQSGVWNTQTLEFDPYPKPTKIATQKFMDRFFDDEKIALTKLAKTNDRAASFVQITLAGDFVDLTTTFNVKAVTALEEGGFIGPGRAAIILA